MALNVDIESANQGMSLNVLKQYIFMRSFGELKPEHLNVNNLNDEITNLIFNNDAEENPDKIINVRNMKWEKINE